MTAPGKAAAAAAFLVNGTALLQLGCDLAQGYGISRPMPAGQVLAWTATWKPDPSWSDLPWLGGDLNSAFE